MSTSNVEKLRRTFSNEGDSVVSRITIKRQKRGSSVTRKVDQSSGNEDPCCKGMSACTFFISCLFHVLTKHRLENFNIALWKSLNTIRIYKKWGPYF